MKNQNERQPYEHPAAYRERVSNEEQTQFVVKTKGYQETFSTKTDAEKQYDILRKRSIKKDENIKVELSEVDNKSGKKKVLKNLNLTEDFNH